MIKTVKIKFANIVLPIGMIGILFRYIITQGQTDAIQITKGNYHKTYPTRIPNGNDWAHFRARSCEIDFQTKCKKPEISVSVSYLVPKHFRSEIQLRMIQPLVLS